MNFLLPPHVCSALTFFAGFDSLCQCFLKAFGARKHRRDTSFKKKSCENEVVQMSKIPPHIKMSKEKKLEIQTPDCNLKVFFVSSLERVKEGVTKIHLCHLIFFANFPC